MKTSCTILFVCISCFSSGQDVKHETQISGLNKPGTTSTEVMTKRIKEAALHYQHYASVPRLVQYDYAFGANEAEFIGLNTFGILYITSLNRDKSEYPINRVYIKSEDKETELTKLGSINIPVTDSTIQNIFGNNRVDYYYYIPYSNAQLPGELLIDWNANRKNFVLCKLPQKVTLDYISRVNSHPVDKKEIDQTVLSGFLEREFQIAITTK